MFCLLPYGRFFLTEEFCDIIFQKEINMDSWNLQNITFTYKYLVVISTFLLLFCSVKSIADFNENITDKKINFDNVFTEQAVFAFFVGFGGLGYVLSKFLKINVWLTLVLSVIVGLVFMCFYDVWISKIQNRNKIKEAELLKLVGKEGKNKKVLYPHSEGQIELLVDGQVVVTNILNNTEEEISEETQLKIIKLEKGILFVEKV